MEGERFESPESVEKSPGNNVLKWMPRHLCRVDKRHEKCIAANDRYCETDYELGNAYICAVLSYRVPIERPPPGGTIVVILLLFIGGTVILE